MVLAPGSGHVTYFLTLASLTHAPLPIWIPTLVQPREEQSMFFDDIIASFLVDSFEREFCLGVFNIRPPALIEHLRENLSQPFKNPIDMASTHNLDFYIEVQRHGLTSLKSNSSILVTDPSFEGTNTGATLKKIASQYNLQYFVHRGFNLKADEVPFDFRGPNMQSLAKRISDQGVINARVIGDAARDVVLNSKDWFDRGTTAEVLQELKLLWHCLVRYG